MKLVSNLIFSLEAKFSFKIFISIVIVKDKHSSISGKSPTEEMKKIILFFAYNKRSANISSN